METTTKDDGRGAAKAALGYIKYDLN